MSDTPDTRDWKTAKPRWVVDDAMAEVKLWRRRAALSWPTEQAPNHVFFCGGYDQITGEISEGTFYGIGGVSMIVELAKGKTPDSYRAWLFDGSSHVPRGPFFATQREAVLFSLWQRCHRHAADLEPLWSALEELK